VKTNTVIFTNYSTESIPSHFLKNFRHITYKENKTITKKISQRRDGAGGRESQGSMSKCYSVTSTISIPLFWKSTLLYTH